jgi:hypothetical protein
MTTEDLFDAGEFEICDICRLSYSVFDNSHFVILDQVWGAYSRKEVKTVGDLLLKLVGADCEMEQVKKKKGKGITISSDETIDWEAVRKEGLVTIGFLDYRDLARLIASCTKSKLEVKFNDQCSKTVKTLLEWAGVNHPSHGVDVERALNLFVQYMARDSTVQQMRVTEITWKYLERHAIIGFMHMAKADLKLTRDLQEIHESARKTSKVEVAKVETKE